MCPAGNVCSSCPVVLKELRTDSGLLFEIRRPPTLTTIKTVAGHRSCWRRVTLSWCADDWTCFRLVMWCRNRPTSRRGPSDMIYVLFRSLYGRRFPLSHGAAWRASCELWLVSDSEVTAPRQDTTPRSAQCDLIIHPLMTVIIATSHSCVARKKYTQNSACRLVLCPNWPLNLSWKQSQVDSWTLWVKFLCRTRHINRSLQALTLRR